MKEKIVLAKKNLPIKSNPWTYFFIVTCLHYWNTPMYVVIGVPILIFVLSVIVSMQETEIDIFEDLSNENEQKKKYQSKFQERLAQMAKEKGIKTDTK